MATPQPNRALHFIGIGGTGMSPLAEIALHRGIKVTGSDAKASGTTDRLTALGARIDFDQTGGLLTAGQTVIVSSAIATANDELVRAYALKLEVRHRSDLLNDLMNSKRPITIAGTHGKTTTTALIAHMLKSLGQDPTAAIGGTFTETGSPALVGDGPWFVAEIDESDGSHTKYRPFVSVLTNVDKDHLDHFKDEAALADSFSTYLSHTDPDGSAVVCWDDKGSQEVGSRHLGNRISYGFRIGSEVRALDYAPREGRTVFRAVVERDLFTVSLPLIGRHNVLNALCALAVARVLELDVAAAAESLASYKGVERRLSLRFDSQDVKVYDDYAHNPGKIAACLAGLKECWPHHFLHAVFQAHRYSRLETMYAETMASFANADAVTVLPVYAAGEARTKDFPPSLLAREITRYSQVPAASCDELERCALDLVHSWKGPTVFITLGAGDVWKVSQKMGELFHENPPARQSDGSHRPTPP